MEVPDAPQRPAPKRWPIALLVAFLTGLAGAVIVVPVTEWAMNAHRVSNFEGARGYAIVFIWVPLAFIAGFVTGFIVGLRIKRTGFAGYVMKQGIAVAAIAALIGAVGGLSYPAADRAPLIDGKPLAVDIEVRVPAKGRSVAQLQAEDFTVALIAAGSDRNYSDVRWSEARQEGDFIVVPAWSRLLARNANREITAGVRDENRQIFNVRLHASPKQIAETWSEWAGPTQRFDGSKPAAEDEYLVRYRVRFATEYSPTPFPTATPAEPPPESS